MQLRRHFSPAGSSPRVRGTPGKAHQQLPSPGIIPACAGNTLVVTSIMPWAWDHPRVCGEHDGKIVEIIAGTGSSPRVRGTPGEKTGDHVGQRDHPRVCGEHGIVMAVLAVGPGSSPRVRGTRDTPNNWRYSAGIIPACAGNTTPRRKRTCATRDHPRVCGEHASRFCQLAFIAGSSPRVRGTLHAGGGLDAKRGIIPACAGNTMGATRSQPPAWDHPRVCGEHTVSVLSPDGNTGSSPRVRGTLI